MQARTTNIDQLVFNTVQDGFLGGYLAAGMSKTGKVATYGGEQFGTVTIYMDGFWDGVQYYNQQHHNNVKVLGWNEKTQKGTFVGNFTDLGAGQAITNTFISDGADVIFPVAGGVGLGPGQGGPDRRQQRQARHHDVGGHRRLRERGRSTASTSSPAWTKGITTAVKTAVLSAANGTFKGGTYIGTLANGGAVLAPFHDFASMVPPSLQSELNTLKAQIESGKIVPATKSPV